MTSNGWAQPAAVPIVDRASILVIGNDAVEVLGCQAVPGFLCVSYVNRTRSVKGAVSFLVVRDAVVREVAMLGRFAHLVVQQTEIATAVA